MLMMLGTHCASTYSSISRWSKNSAVSRSRSVARASSSIRSNAIPSSLTVGSSSPGLPYMS